MESCEEWEQKNKRVGGGGEGRGVGVGLRRIAGRGKGGKKLVPKNGVVVRRLSELPAPIQKVGCLFFFFFFFFGYEQII